MALSDGTVNSTSSAACFLGCNEVVVLVGLGGPFSCAVAGG
ncbi:hypothetical protein FBZ33_0818 [Micromonospora sp. A202]|nr:hypothetical protein FBZ33_0818 [Micromonospora sp. A202]SCG36323.1 hypothetical protein GA0070619_0326 [Micromonospora zamorensis]